MAQAFSGGSRYWLPYQFQSEHDRRGLAWVIPNWRKQLLWSSAILVGLRRASPSASSGSPPAPAAPRASSRSVGGGERLTRKTASFALLLLYFQFALRADSDVPERGGLISAELRWDTDFGMKCATVPRGRAVHVTLLRGGEVAIAVLPSYGCSLAFHRVESRWFPTGVEGFSGPPPIDRMREMIVLSESKRIDTSIPGRRYARPSDPTSEDLQVVIPSHWSGDRELTDREWEEFRLMALRDVRLSSEPAETSVEVFLPRPKYLDPQARVVMYWYPGGAPICCLFPERLERLVFASDRPR